VSHPELVYPPPAYAGDGGLVNATLQRATADPDLTYRSGGTVHYLATRTSTNGLFGLYRWTMTAEPSGPEPHFHRSISESFYVLSGTVRLYDGRGWVDGQPGDFLFVPEGGIHGFRNESGAAAAMLILFAPGADREDYFETLARVGRGLTMDDAERAAFFLRHDTFWTG
jgi:mannose-6-phosphate isomerase-like protein (cupin superfamily)